MTALTPLKQYQNSTENVSCPETQNTAYSLPMIRRRNEKEKKEKKVRQHTNYRPKKSKATSFLLPNMVVTKIDRSRYTQH